MEKNIELLQGLIDQAVKSGLMANLETAAAVHKAWNEIKEAANAGIIHKAVSDPSNK